MSKICPNCQTEFDDSHGFCSNCGSRLVDNYGSVDPVLNLGDANAISGGVNINQSKNEPTLKSKACFRCLFITKIISG